MNIFVFFRYLLLNLLWFNCVPHMIWCYGHEWFSFIEKCEDNIWYIRYSRFIDSYHTESFISVSNRFIYIAYLKMVYRLWKLRNVITIKSDYGNCYRDLI